MNVKGLYISSVFHLTTGLVLAGLLAPLQAADPPIVKVSPVVLRRLAALAGLPLYPPEALEKKVSGVVVVEVVVGDGSLLSSNLLEAPDEYTGRSVLRALSAWRFNSPEPKEGAPIRLTSRLAFYFRIVDGRPVVIDGAQQMFGRTKK